MRVLCINSYAGSLVLGATAAGAEVVGSFEDAGFGIGLQKANFPHLRFVDHRRDWPDDLDLSDVIVLAHPPCAAFSQQNNSPAKKGTNTDAFECTRVVLHYCMQRNAAAICVESVMGALGGAWDVHDHFAERYGYHLYRVVKNSLLMGVPQYRERFWAVFVREGTADPQMTWTLSPRVRTVASVLEGMPEGTPVLARRDETLYDKVVLRYVDRVVAEGGLTRDQALAALNPDLTWRRTSYARVLQARHFPDLRHQQVCKKMICNFASAQPSFLPPGGYAPVLLGSSLWLYKGQVCTEEQYKVIMGFPADYIFPDSYRTKLRSYLSKGVCPPVASWILQNVAVHLGLRPSGEVFEVPNNSAYVKVIAPGRVVSFRVGKNVLRDYLKVRWEGQTPAHMPLRNEEEDLEA